MSYAVQSYALHQRIINEINDLHKLDNLFINADGIIYSDSSCQNPLELPISLELVTLQSIRVLKPLTITLSDIDGNEVYRATPLLVEDYNSVQDGDDVVVWEDVLNKPDFENLYLKRGADNNWMPFGEFRFRNSVFTDPDPGVARDLKAGHLGMATVSLRVGSLAGIVKATGGVLSASALLATEIPALDASKITTGTFDLARLPALPSSNTIVCTTIPAMSAGDQLLVAKGTVVIESDTGNTYRYSGAGSVVLNASYIQQSDLSPDWAVITNRPTLVSTWTNDAGYLTAASNVAWAKITGTPTTLAGYGITDALTTAYVPAWSAISGKPNTLAGYGIASTDTMFDSKYAPAVHAHTFASLTSKPTTLAGYGITDALASSWTPSWSQVTSKPTGIDNVGVHRLYRSEDGSLYYGKLTWSTGSWAGNGWTWTMANDQGDSQSGVFTVRTSYADLANRAHGLQSARTIAGVSFDGTANIAIPFANLASKPTTLAGYGVTVGDTLFDSKYQAKNSGGDYFPTYPWQTTIGAWSENNRIGSYNIDGSYVGTAPTDSLNHAILGFGQVARQTQIVSPYDRAGIYYRKWDGNTSQWIGQWSRLLDTTTDATAISNWNTAYANYFARGAGAIHAGGVYGFTEPTLGIGDTQYGMSAFGGYLNLYSALGSVKLYSRVAGSPAVYVGTLATQEYIDGNYMPMSKSVGGTDGFTWSYDQTSNAGKLNLTLWDDNDGSEAFQLLNNGGGFIAGFYSNRVSNFYNIQENGVALSTKYALAGHTHSQYLKNTTDTLTGTLTVTTAYRLGTDAGFGLHGDGKNLYIQLTSQGNAITGLIAPTTVTANNPIIGRYDYRFYGMFAGIGDFDTINEGGSALSSKYQGLIAGLTQTAWNNVSGNVHSHPNMGELNAIGTGDIAKWNDVTSKVYNARIGVDTYMGDDSSTMRARMLAYGNHFGRANYAGTPAWYNFIMLRETVGTNYGSIGYSADGNWYSAVTDHQYDTTTYKKIWDSGNFNPGNYQPLENQRLSNGNDVTFNTVRVGANNQLGLFVGDDAAIGDANFQNGLRIQGLGNGATGYWVYGNGTHYMGWNGSAFVADGVNLILEGDARLTNARTPTAHTHNILGNLGGTNFGRNLDTQYVDGVTQFAVYTVDAPAGDKPFGSWTKVMEIAHSDSNWTHQIAFDYFSNSMAFRRKDATNWQSWNHVYHSGNFNPGNYQPLENQRLSTTNTVTFADVTVRGGLRTDMTVSGDSPGQGAHVAIYDSVGSKGWLLQHGQSNDRLSFMHLDAGPAWNSKIYFTANGDIAANGMVVAGSWGSGTHAVGGGWAWGGHDTMNTNFWSGFMHNINGETLIGSTNSMPLRLAVNQADVASFSGTGMNVHCAKVVIGMTNAWNTGSATTYPTLYGTNSPSDGNPYVMIPSPHVPYSAKNNFTCNNNFDDAANGGARIRFAVDKNASSFGDFGILPSRASAFTATLPIYVNSDKVLTAIDSDGFVQGVPGRRSTNSTGGTLWSAKPAGFYSHNGDSINGTTGGASWTHLINCRGSDWGDAGQYTFQIASSFSGDGNNAWGNETYAMRTITAGTPNSWKTLWHSGNLVGNRTEHTHDQYLTSANAATLYAPKNVNMQLGAVGWSPNVSTTPTAICNTTYTNLGSSAGFLEIIGYRIYNVAGTSTISLAIGSDVFWTKSLYGNLGTGDTFKVKLNFVKGFSASSFMILEYTYGGVTTMETVVTPTSTTASGTINLIAYGSVYDVGAGIHSRIMIA